MSRSRKRTPISPNACASSEKGDKVRANRKFRRVTRERIRADSEAPPDIREVSSVWLFAKDGRHFVRNPEIAARIIRK
ncbi:MAG: hypothetical protein WC935_06665 [Thermoleophilia bacterium]|jgi:hypothetical protein